MSIEGMVVEWRRVAEAADEFYARTERRLIAGETLPPKELEALLPLTEAMVSSSERTRDEAIGPLEERGATRELAADLLVAAAAVDALLARDLAALDPISVSRLAPGRRLSSAVIERLRPAPVEADEGRPDQVQQVAEGRELLAQVQALFDDTMPEGGLPLIAGRAPVYRTPYALIGDVRDTVTDVVDTAVAPTKHLIAGFFVSAGLGVTHVISAAELVKAVNSLDPSLGKALQPAPKMLRQHVLKLAAVMPEGWGFNSAAEALTDRLSPQRLLQKVADAPGAVKISAACIQMSDPAVVEERASVLIDDLERLETSYKKHLKWLRRSAAILRYGALPLATAANAAVPGGGWLIMPGVFALGTGYVAYSLTDRLDARNLGPADLVDGVVRLVERRIP